MARTLNFLVMLLVGVGPAGGTVLTVGPSGTYPTIQQAINASIVGQNTEIRVEGGKTYFENILVPDTFTAGSLELTGGWDNTFSVRDTNPADTTIDGLTAVRPLEIRMTGGTFTLEGFTISNGVAFGDGGGIFVFPPGDRTVTVTLRNLRIDGNLANYGDDLNGGGIAAYLNGNEQLIIEDCRIRNNEVLSTGGGFARGGGISVFMGDSGHLRIVNTEIKGNTLQSTGPLVGAGLFLSAIENATMELVSTHPFGNSATGPWIVATGAYIETGGASSLTIERCGFALNTATGDTAPQIESIQTGTASLTIRDSGTAWADDIGFRLSASGSSEVHLINLSIADNASTGLSLQQGDTATLTLYNSIAYGNGTDVTAAGAVDMGFNLFAVDPMFANPEELDYRIRPGSPAENAGTNTPPGGLGSTDFGGDPRLQDGTVDIGMYEGIAYDVFSDGFESGDTSAWSSSVP